MRLALAARWCQGRSVGEEGQGGEGGGGGVGGGEGDGGGGKLEEQAEMPPIKAKGGRS